MAVVRAGGVEIPALGFGTWQLEPEVAYRMVTHALKVGYRHIDTAQIYGNEEAVGSAIADSDVPRADIWLTTKVWVDRFGQGALQRSVEESLEKLKVPKVDLLLLHWPKSPTPLEEALTGLVDAQARGYTDHIGVSNYSVAWVERANALLKAMDGSPRIITNQVEYHPYLTQGPLLECLRQNDLSLTGYSPLASGAAIGDRTLERIGKAHGKSGPQVALKWLIQQPGVMALPRTSSEAHCASNFDIFDFELSAGEMAEIANLARADGRQIDPKSLAPEWDT